MPRNDLEARDMWRLSRRPLCKVHGVVQVMVDVRAPSVLAARALCYCFLGHASHERVFSFFLMQLVVKDMFLTESYSADEMMRAVSEHTGVGTFDRIHLSALRGLRA